MNRVNDQTILEEDYDENYQPTEDGRPIRSITTVSAYRVW